MDAQSHFSEDYLHFFLKPRELEKRKVEKVKPDFKGKRAFPVNSRMRKGVLRSKAEAVKERSLTKRKIFNEHKLFFIIKFSDSFSWTGVRKTLDSLQGTVTNIYDDNTVKIAIRKDDYENFVQALEDGRRYINDIIETSEQNKIDKELMKLIERDEDKACNVTVEVVNLSGLRNMEELESSIKMYTRRENGEIDLGYRAKGFAVFVGKMYPKTIKDIANDIDIVENISILPDVYLGSSIGSSPREIGLASIISSSTNMR